MGINDVIEFEEGYEYQILCKYKNGDWEHCDYAKDRQERDYLLGEYRLAYGKNFKFRVIHFKSWLKGKRGQYQRYKSEEKS